MEIVGAHGRSRGVRAAESVGRAWGDHGGIAGDHKEMTGEHAWTEPSNSQMAVAAGPSRGEPSLRRTWWKAMEGW